MRRIKFRGRSINYVAANDSYWAYGLLVNDDPPEIECDDGDIYRVNDNTVGQFTGLKDSNGKEIYEGDILSLREGSDEMIKVIDFYAAITALDLSEMMNLRLLDYYFERGEVHVIGNIYDNPELLEVTE